MAVEKELLEGISLMKQGKEEGFNILYSYTYNFVYARARAATKNVTDAQDLTQETFIQAYNGIASLEDANNIYAWLGGIVFRQGAKLYRKRKKEFLVDEDQDYIFDEIETKDPDALPEASTELRATSDVIMSMIEELPELQRSAIISFYYDHMKIEEIAKIFGCSVNTIKSRLNYAKKFLKSKIEEHQKQYSYKLFSFSPAILLYALRELLSSEEYTMDPAAAEKVYRVACETLGITASAIGAGTAATTASSAAASTAATKGAGIVGKFLSLSVAKKTGIVLLATTLLGGGVTAGVLLTDNTSEPPAIVEDLPAPTDTPIITSTPSVIALPSSDDGYVYSLEEYYAYLGQQAKTGAEKAQVYIHPEAFPPRALPNTYVATVFENVPELQRYAGVNVSLNATISKDRKEVEYSCTNGEIHTTQFRIAEVTFTYGNTEIAAYNEEDYWEKMKAALKMRMNTFTVYTIKSPEWTAQWNKFRFEEYPSEELAAVFESAVCYQVDSKRYGLDSTQTLSVNTFYCTYPDSNDIIIWETSEVLDTISAWYEGSKEPGVTFYINGSGGNFMGISISEKMSYLQDWFASQYPSSEYVMETEALHDSANYYTCSIKKPGDPEPIPEAFPPVDSTISLAPIATPSPTSNPIPDTVLSEEETVAAATRIISEIITPSMSETEKAKAIHDYMILHMDPDTFAEYFHIIPEERTTVNGALGSGYASCAGYAATFRYLCDLAGLEAISVTGQTTTCTEHTWNQVKIDGAWYHIDVCGDEHITTLVKDFDDHSFATYRYFLVSDSELGYTLPQADPSIYPCTAKSITYDALEYGCPWAFLVFNPSEEEITLTAEKAAAEGRTHMKLIFTDRRYGDGTKRRNLEDTVYMGIYKSNYAMEGLIISEQSEIPIGETTYYTYDIHFMTKDGIPVTYPYADTEEEVHRAISQALSEQKLRIDIFAPDLSFLRAAVSTYPHLENQKSLPYANRTNYGSPMVRPDTLFYISLFPEKEFNWPY